MVIVEDFIGTIEDSIMGLFLFRFVGAIAQNSFNSHPKNIMTFSAKDLIVGCSS